jgi:hypothetical protein
MYSGLGFLPPSRDLYLAITNDYHYASIVPTPLDFLLLIH